MPVAGGSPSAAPTGSGERSRWGTQPGCCGPGSATGTHPRYPGPTTRSRVPMVTPGMATSPPGSSRMAVAVALTRCSVPFVSSSAGLTSWSIGTHPDVSCVGHATSAQRSPSWMTSTSVPSRHWVRTRPLSPWARTSLVSRATHSLMADGTPSASRSSGPGAEGWAHRVATATAINAGCPGAIGTFDSLRNGRVVQMSCAAEGLPTTARYQHRRPCGTASSAWLSPTTVTKSDILFDLKGRRFPARPPYGTVALRAGSCFLPSRVFASIAAAQRSVTDSTSLTSRMSCGRAFSAWFSPLTGSEYTRYCGSAQRHCE